MSSVIWKPTASHTIVPSSTVVEGEVLALSYDATNDLGEGQAPVSPTISLVDMQTKLPVENEEADDYLDDVPLAGNIINMRVSGIKRGRIYELMIGFNHTNPRVDGEHTIRIHVIEGV